MVRTPRGHAGRLARRGPYYHDERRQWVQYAFDPSERPVVGLRRREWQAIAESEEAVVREMGRCLRELGAGRAPR